MACIKCNSKRVASFQAKSSDCNFVSIDGVPDHNGYVPRDMNIGGGDYVRFEYCLDCGQMQGNFPLPVTKQEEARDEE